MKRKAVTKIWDSKEIDILDRHFAEEGESRKVGRGDFYFMRHLKCVCVCEKEGGNVQCHPLFSTLSPPSICESMNVLLLLFLYEV